MVGGVNQGALSLPLAPSLQGGTAVIKIRDLIWEGVVGGLYATPQVSAPFHSTHSIYTLREKPANPSDIRFFSVGSLVGIVVHFCMFFAPSFPEQPWGPFCEARFYSSRDIPVLQFLEHVWKSAWT